MKIILKFQYQQKKVLEREKRNKRKSKIYIENNSNDSSITEINDKSNDITRTGNIFKETENSISLINTNCQHFTLESFSYLSVEEQEGNDNINNNELGDFLKGLCDEFINNDNKIFNTANEGKKLNYSKKYCESVKEYYPSKRYKI
jgi:hypothetical protein